MTFSYPRIRSSSVCIGFDRSAQRVWPPPVVLLLAYRLEPARAFEWLDKAAEYHDSLLGIISFDPWLDSLHADPRWVPLLQRLGKTPEQLAAIKFDVKVPK